MTADNARRSSELADAVRRNPRRRCTIHNLWHGGGNSASGSGAKDSEEKLTPEDSHQASLAPQTSAAPSPDPARDASLDAENLVAKPRRKKLVPSKSTTIKTNTNTKTVVRSSQPQQEDIPQPQEPSNVPIDENDSLHNNQARKPRRKHFTQRKRSLPAPPPVPPHQKPLETTPPTKRQNPAPPKRRRTTEVQNDIQVLQASVQAQVAARAALEVHASWLEKRNKELTIAAAEAQQWKEAHLMASEDADALRMRCTDLVQSLRRADSTRRALHEAHMTLRGNMRVFCRLRPGTGADAFNAQTGTVGDLRVRAPASKTVDGRDEAAKVLHFKFDYVFPDDARQCDVFDEVQGLVQSALDGHNVCIFAYGQTGSGKTHTMSNHTGADPGIIPRALELILREHSQKPRLSLLEIYNEELRDLLAPVSADSQGKRSRNAGKRKAASSAAAPKLRIRIDPKRGKPQLQGLSEVAISSAAHARDLLQRAEDSRMVARTNANERSSRSHVVLTLALDHADSNTTSRIHLVDLAGSERIAHAGSDRSAKQLKEQCSINTSLVALKNALRALATQQTHIPFRDSKLTYLLQDALESQTCKTLMLCNLSQDSENIPESLNTLRFASQVLQN